MLLQYPPAAHMLAVLVISKKEEDGQYVVNSFAGLIKKSITDDAPYIIGPAKACISKINDLYRHILYFKHADYEKLVQIKDMLEIYSKEQNFRYQNIQYDFDPMNIY